MESSATSNKIFKQAFTRVEIIIYVLEYYDFCDKSVKVWKQLCSFTRSRLIKNEEIVSKFIKNKRVLMLNTFAPSTLEFLIQWMKFYKLSINAQTKDSYTSFYNFLVDLNNMVYKDLNIKDIHLDRIYLMKKHENYSGILKLLRENLGFESLLNCNNLLVSKCNTTITAIPSVISYLHNHINDNGYYGNWDKNKVDEHIEKINVDEELFYKYLNINKVDDCAALAQFCNYLKKPVRYLQLVLNAYDTELIKEDYTVNFDPSVAEHLEKIVIKANFKEERKGAEAVEIDINIAAHNHFLSKLLTTTALQRTTINFDMDVAYDVTPPNLKIVFKRCILNVVYKSFKMPIMAEEICVILTEKTVKSFEFNYDKEAKNSNPQSIKFHQLYNVTFIYPKCINLFEIAHKPNEDIICYEISDEYLDKIEINPSLFFTKNNNNQDITVNGMLSETNVSNIFTKHQDKVELKWENAYIMHEVGSVSLETICGFLPKARLHEFRQEYWNAEEINYASDK